MRAARSLVLVLAAGLAAGAAAGPSGRAPEGRPEPGKPGKPLKEAVECPRCGTWHPPDIPCPKLPEERAKPVRCPACGVTFKAAKPVRLSGHGGLDRDFCKYPRNPRTQVAVVWTCPGCGYTQFASAFGEKVDAATVRFVAESFKPGLRARLAKGVKVSEEFYASVPQSDIPDRVKYDLALKLADRARAPASVRAKLAVEGVYACRREFGSSLRVPALAGAEGRVSRQLASRGANESDPDTVVAHLKEILRTVREARRKNPSPDAAGSELPAADEIVLWFRLAVACNRLGQPLAARSCVREVLDRIAAFRVSPAMKTLAETFRAREEVLDGEERFREAAILHMREALRRGEYKATNLVPLAYLLGEFLRRAGRPAEALAWYDLTLRLEGAERTVGPWIAIHRAHPLFRDQAASAEETKLAEAAAGRAGVKLGPRPAPPETPERVPEPAAGGPKTCADALQRIHRALRAYIRDRGEAPDSLEALVEAGLLTREAAAGFRCPESGKPYIYRKPRGLSDGRQFVLFHLDPQECPCKNILHLDGTLGRLAP